MARTGRLQQEEPVPNRLLLKQHSRIQYDKNKSSKAVKNRNIKPNYIKNHFHKTTLPSTHTETEERYMQCAVHSCIQSGSKKEKRQEKWWREEKEKNKNKTDKRTEKQIEPSTNVNQDGRCPIFRGDFANKIKRKVPKSYQHVSSKHLQILCHYCNL